MIERCLYCGKIHETEPDGPIKVFGDMTLKVCPEHPDDNTVTGIDVEAIRQTARQKAYFDERGNLHVNA